MTRLAGPLLLALVPGCLASLDLQAELLLHPEPFVQAPALVGAVFGATAGLPLWGPAALAAGPDSRLAAYALNACALPPALALGGLPRLLAGPSGSASP